MYGVSKQTMEDNDLAWLIKEEQTFKGNTEKDSFVITMKTAAIKRTSHLVSLAFDSFEEEGAE